MMMITLTLVKAGQNETRPAQKDLRRQVLKPTVKEMWNFYCFQLRDNALQKNKKRGKHLYCTLLSYYQLVIASS